MLIDAIAAREPELEQVAGVRVGRPDDAGIVRIDLQDGPHGALEAEGLLRRLFAASGLQAAMRRAPTSAPRTADAARVAMHNSRLGHDELVQKGP
jgi:hypothetical protein